MDKQEVKRILNLINDKEPGNDCLDPEWLGAYLEGSLSEKERKKVERHLADCNKCLDEMLELKNILKEQEEEIPPYLVFTREEKEKEHLRNFSVSCFRCGKEISEGDRTCPHCNMKIVIEEEEQKELWREINLWLPEMLRNNRWLAGSIVAIAASFAFPGALFQFLLAGGIMGGMWVFERGKGNC